MKTTHTHDEFAKILKLNYQSCDVSVIQIQYSSRKSTCSYL